MHHHQKYTKVPPPPHPPVFSCPNLVIRSSLRSISRSQGTKGRETNLGKSSTEPTVGFKEKKGSSVKLTDDPGKRSSVTLGRVKIAFGVRSKGSTCTMHLLSTNFSDD